MATLKQNSEALRAITDKLKSLPKRHVLTEVTLTPSKDDVVAVPNEGEAFSKVTVNGDTNLVAENIAEGVSIFGVTGTHSSGASDLDAFIAGATVELHSMATKIDQYKCAYMRSLISASFPNATIIGYRAFFNSTVLTHVSFPSATEVGKGSFQTCGQLQRADFHKATLIKDSAFDSCYPLKSVILRSETVCTLESTSAFTNCYRILGTKIAEYNPYGDKDGYFYVPSHLVESDKTATNWSTYASQIRAIEGEGGGEEEGNWLFQDEVFTSYSRTDLPAPEIGVSYTLFVDGEEIGTATATANASDGSATLQFNTEDYRIYFIYDYSTGLYWHFHPIDSQVQSGSVSIRINTVNSGGNND